MLVGMGMLVFGSLEYYIENAEPGTGFTSIPQVNYIHLQFKSLAACLSAGYVVGGTDSDLPGVWRLLASHDPRQDCRFYLCHMWGKLNGVFDPLDEQIPKLTLAVQFDQYLFTEKTLELSRRLNR